jgi:hypothetical protein
MVRKVWVAISSNVRIMRLAVLISTASLIASIIFFMRSQHLKPLLRTENTERVAVPHTTAEKAHINFFQKDKDLVDDDTDINLLPLSTLSFLAYENVSIHVISAMTTDYSRKFASYIEANQAYCRIHGYNYSLFISDSGSAKHPTGLKITSAIEALTDHLSNAVDSRDRTQGWIIYLDADAFAAERSLPVSVLLNAAEKLHRSMSSVARQCHFIAQDQNHIVNTGAFLVLISEWSLQFLRQWKQEFELAHDNWGLQLWVYDQGALQNLLLHYAANMTGNYYNNSCVGKGHQANICYHNVMSRFGLPYKQRFYGNVCLVPPIGVPYSFHIHNGYSRGELFHHRKSSLRAGVNSVLTIDEINKPSVLWFDRNVIKFANGTFIRYINPKALNPYVESIYVVIDSIIHYIPDWPTFLYLGGGNISNAVLVSSIVFNSLSEGADILSVDG